MLRFKKMKTEKNTEEVKNSTILRLINPITGVPESKAIEVTAKQEVDE